MALYHGIDWLRLLFLSLNFCKMPQLLGYGLQDPAQFEPTTPYVKAREMNL